MTLSKDQLKEIFVTQSGILSDEEFNSIAASAAQNRQPLDHLLMERGLVAPNHFLTLLSEYYKVPSTELRVSEIDQSVLTLVSEAFAASHFVIPFAKEDNTIKVAMLNPQDKEILDAVAKMTQLTIEPYIASEHAIKRALILYSGDLADKLASLIKTAEAEAQHPEGKSVTSSSVTELIDIILERAVFTDASDIHIEPFEIETIVRLRIDGLLKTVTILPISLQNTVVARIKVLANLKMDEKRLPQDGRFSKTFAEEEVNFRVSTVPSMWGEKIVMRVLRKEAQLFDLGSMGFLETDLDTIKRGLQNPFGMILVCGPTGSGKTSTLYSFLQEIGLQRIDVVNISTIEDPIEYTMPRVTQIQIHPEIDLTFASGLRSLLRQDPDIIMVGEIRDKETADIAVRAALVGRLLLSSLHTNDAVGAIPRLMDMEVEPYLVASTLSLVIAQRLVRKLCENCRESYTPDTDELKQLESFHSMADALHHLSELNVVSKQTTLESLRFYKSKGCEKCDNTGYIGRTAIFEILHITDTLKNMISAGENSVALKEQALKDGMKTMFTDGLAKAILGITDLKEVTRVAI